MVVISYVIIGLIVFCVVALLLTPNLFHPSPEAQRIFDVVKTGRIDRRTIDGKDKSPTRMQGIAKKLRMRLALSESPELKERLYLAGIRGTTSTDLFFVSQFIVPAAAAGAGCLIGTNALPYILGLGALGYIAPNMWLKWKTKGRQRRIRRGIPDALDLMVICVDSGLGLDQALLRVGDELVSVTLTSKKNFFR